MTLIYIIIYIVSIDRHIIAKDMNEERRPCIVSYSGYNDLGWHELFARATTFLLYLTFREFLSQEFKKPDQYRCPSYQCGKNYS